MMNALEILKELDKLGVLGLIERLTEDMGNGVKRYYVEDCESYCGCAYVYIDKDGNCIKIEKC